MNTALALGLDFGTESVRALLVDTVTGKEFGEGIAKYTHGVMDRTLHGAPLPAEFALQNGNDYLDAMALAVRAALASMKSTHPERIAFEIAGIGLDFTASSPMPVAEDGRAMSELFPSDPHAYVKLWKHHAAQAQADFINENAPRNLLDRYGGAVSCEWSLPKLMEFEAASPAIFEKTAFWIEAGDWVVATLCNRADRPVRSVCQAGYKGLWSREAGYPSPEFLASCSPKINARFERLMSGPVQALGTEAGTLSEFWAEKLGLPVGIPVATAVIDAHAGVPGSGVVESGNVLCVIGTSTCHMALSKDLRLVRGVAGAVPDGIVPGLVGFEAGQPAVGDLFSWFMRIHGKQLSAEDFAEIEKEAAKVPPGSNDLLALDWWNGNRSVLMDANLKGTLVGLRLTTTAPEIYRALIEATAFGTRVILDTMRGGGISLPKITLTGGIAAKSPLLCQIYADVLGQSVEVVQARQPVALGAAIYGAFAAESKKAKSGPRGNAGAFAELTQRMTSEVARRTVEPKNADRYRQPYERYRALHDLMARFYTEAYDYAGQDPYRD